MYLELKKKIRQYKASDEFRAESQELVNKSLWDYNISFKKNTQPFLPSYFNIKLDSNKYELDNFSPIEFNNTLNEDIFEKECYGINGTISSVINAEHVDSDWMTGVFLAREITSSLTSGKFNSIINTWHNGCQNGILRGFNHFYQSSKYCGNKRIKWEWKGVDLKPNPLPILIGAMGNGDVCIGSNIISLGNKLKEEWKDGVDILIHDIYPVKEKILISGILSACIFLNDLGYLVLRLPEPHKWDTNTVNIILTICMIFKNVNIWIPKWGLRCGQKKIYLIACKKKKTIFKDNHRGFLQILNNKGHFHFLKSTVYDDEEIKEWLEILTNIKNEIINDSDEQCIRDDWISILMNNLLPLSKKI